MEWKIKGEVILSCNCDVFCPCVISLGKARPTEGYCHSWWGINITEGFAGDEKLDGLRIGILLDVPGKMGEGGWSVALYIDSHATDIAATHLEKIFTGQAGGSLAILSLLVKDILGIERADISFNKIEKGWHMTVKNATGKIADCAIEKQVGKDKNSDVIINNSQYWVASDITVAVGTKSKVRAFGRIWDFSGQSAEYAPVEWSSNE